MTEKPVREHDKFMLRLPDGLRDRIAAYAKAHGRSMNSEIVATLEENYPDLESAVQKRIEHIRDLATEIGGPEHGKTLYDAVTDLVGFLADIAEDHHIENVPGEKQKP